MLILIAYYLVPCVVLTLLTCTAVRMEFILWTGFMSWVEWQEKRESNFTAVQQHRVL